MRDKFTLHSITYRLILGAVVLAFVIPVWASGHQPMSLVALVTISIVTATGVLPAHHSGLHDWLRRR